MTNIPYPTDEFPWLEERTILLSPTGSRVYGTTVETSDHDYKGICVPPIEYYLGLDMFKGYDNVGGKNFKNTKDDVDLSVLHLTKFVKEAMQGVPNNIEILFVRPEDYLKVNPVGQLLLDNRRIFLSKQVKRKFAGFAQAEIKALKASYVSDYEYNTKRFMHGVRLLTGGVEIMDTYDFSTYRPNRELLLDCRNGKYSFNEAVEMLEMHDEELRVSAERSELPEFPDTDKVNTLLIKMNMQALDLMGV